jgi:hypothetical protein
VGSERTSGSNQSIAAGVELRSSCFVITNNVLAFDLQPFVEMWLLDMLCAFAPLKLLLDVVLGTIGKFTM